MHRPSPWILLLCIALAGGAGCRSAAHLDDENSGSVALALSSTDVSSITSTGAVITWSTNLASTSTVEHGTTTSYGLATPLYGLTVEHSVPLTGLSPSTLYHYRITSSDAASSVVSSADFTFTTLSADDGGTVDGGTDAGPPCVGVAVEPPDGLTKALVSSYPEGTTFCLHAGTYRMASSVLMQSSDSLIGEPGTILDFAGAALEGQDGELFGVYGYGSSAGQHDVTVRNIVVENCKATPGANTCVTDGVNQVASGIKEGDNWTVQNVESRYNDNGIEGSCSSCYIHHNGCFGTGGGTIENSDVSYNGGTPDPNGVMGGSKGVQLTNFVWRNNYVHDNLGSAAIWCDGCWQGSNILIENNRIENNLGAGIQFEISWGAIVRGNTLVNNAAGISGQGHSCWWDAQISVNDTQNVEIYGNTIQDDFGSNGICAVDIHRADGTLPRSGQVANLYVHDNIIKMRGNMGLVGRPSAFDPSANNRFENNTYYVTGIAGTYWAWNAYPLTQTQWQAAGQDTAGTFLTW